jgi:hypothetical protein
MIDFVKTDIQTSPEYLLSNPNLNFGAKTNLQTGEVMNDRYGYTSQVAHFGAMQISITTNTQTGYSKIELSGSLHKHKQQGKNHADLTYKDICTTIWDLCDITGLQPDKFIIRHIEYGVNIKPIHSPKNLLNSIVAYKGKGYEIRAYKGKGYMKRFCLSQYDVKVYDKSLQYDLPFDVLRFELKVFKMQVFKRQYIHLKTFVDLLNPDTYTQLFTSICESIDHLYMFDYRIHLATIENQQHRLVLTEGVNTEFWARYRATHSVKGYKNKLQRFNELVSQYAPDNLKTYLLNEISNKWSELQNSTPFLPSVENANVPHIYPLIVGNNSILYPRFCFTCGRDISMQKKGSKYCSEKLNGKEVKKCRNTVSNFELRERRRYNGPTLFDINQYLQPEFRRLKGGFNG